MKLAIKFNISLIIAMIIGATIAGIFANSLLQDNARQEVLEEARIMMQSAVAVRQYTVAEIKPLLAMQQQRAFIKQTVPAYAARQYITKVRKKYPDYNYKEAYYNRGIAYIISFRLMQGCQDLRNSLSLGYKPSENAYSLF